MSIDNVKMSKVNSISLTAGRVGESAFLGSPDRKYDQMSYFTLL